VLATLHASSIKEAISRLWAFLDEQGDELLVQSLQGIVAQHLIHIANNKIMSNKIMPK
jgi:type II secretory ATPase GspE/PulE/Tfp pilus assembly ATPase PilB-like protein